MLFDLTVDKKKLIYLNNTCPLQYTRKGGTDVCPCLRFVLSTVLCKQNFHLRALLLPLWLRLLLFVGIFRCQAPGESYSVV